MKSRTVKKRTAILLLVAVLAVFGAWSFLVYKADCLIDRQMVTAITYPHISPGGNVGVQVNVTSRLHGKGIAHASCELLVTPFAPNRQEITQTLQTDESGLAFFRYVAPDDLRYGASFKLRVRSHLGKSTLFGKWIEIPKDGATSLIHLTSDKRWYQPGQFVHFRALCLESFKLSPQAGKTVDFSLANEMGNAVFNRSVTSGKAGIVASEFYLPPDFLPGEYTLVALCQKMKETIPIKVKYYQARRIKITPDWSRSYLSVASPFSGNISCSYFFGSPVVKGQVKADITTADGRRLAMSGETDAKGNFPIRLTSEEIVGNQPAEKNVASGEFRFCITVEENGQKEEETFVLPYYSADRFCEILPEDGTIFPNQTNKAILVAYFPDGSPAPGKYSVSGSIRREIQVPESGFVPFSFLASQNESTFHIAWYAGDKTRVSTMSFGDYAHNSIVIQAEKNRFGLSEDIPIRIKFRDDLKDKIKAIKLHVTQKGKHGDFA